MTKTNSNVLFLCTGNYYRSRFAEHLFNHYAPDCKLPWRAFSRGLATYLVPKNVGSISPHTIDGLASRGVMEVDTRTPLKLLEEDLAVSHHIVALKYAEHYPLMSQRFPDWTERVEYWHVDDVDEATPEEALPQIEQAVIGLLRRLAAG